MTQLCLGPLVFFLPTLFFFFFIPTLFKRMINTATGSHTYRLNVIFWLQPANSDQNDSYEHPFPSIVPKAAWKSADAPASWLYAETGDKWLWNLNVGQRRWNEVLGLKVRSSFICRNSCLLNINSGVRGETFRQPLAAPYLAALACLFHACGSRQPPEGRPPSSAACILLNASHSSGSRDSLDERTTVQSRLSTSCTSKSAFLPPQACTITAGSSGDNRSGGAGVAYPAFTRAIVVYKLVGEIAF